MLPKEVLDYARKLRHKRLLEKISQGKGLSPSEYRELEEYENMTSKPKKEVKSSAGKLRALSVREEIFCKEYVADFNGTRAAKAAKYSKKTAYAIANRLLKRVEVQRRIEELKEQATRKAGLTLKRVLEELGTLAFSNISDYLEFGPDGVSIRESVKMSREVLACVAEVSEITTNQGKRVKLKLHDKAKALDSLKQYFIDSNTGEDEKKVIRLPLRAPQKMQK